VSFKSISKNWIPPIILSTLRHLSGQRICFFGNYETWNEAAAQCSGYDAEHILAKVLDATLKVKQGEAAYERDSVLFDQIEYTWPTTAALMWVAARNAGRLDVLDFGGALGSTYFQNRAFLAGLSTVNWSVIEQSHYAQAGQNHIQDETLRFYSSIDTCLAETKPNIILLSSVLQYLEEPYPLLKKIKSSDAATIIIDRTPFSETGDHRICIQKVPESIYKADYPMHIFHLATLLNELSDWTIIAETPCPEGSVTTSSGINFKFKGFILERKNSG
jgi:putative methyltransferase (TIGR04325 family)